MNWNAMKKPWSKFQQATFIGSMSQKSEDENFCSQVFDNCPLSSQNVIDVFKTEIDLLKARKSQYF